MKLTIGILLCLICLVQVHALIQRFCFKQTDCSKSECCESRAQPKGKRDLTSLAPGICRPRQKVGGRCIAKFFVPQPNGRLFLRCPCAGGLKCKGTGQFELPIGEIGKCVPRQCRTELDCNKGECCVSRFRPKGKRGTKSSIGTCQPLGKRNSDCLVRNNKPLRKPGAVFVSCPCRRPFTCVGTGKLDIPLGEMGKCRRRYKYGQRED